LSEPANHSLTASVIVPVYNDASNLARLLEGLAKQTVCPIEILVVNDGSKDESPQVAEKWTSDHPDRNLALISQKQSGPATARNNGAKQAKGDLLLFVDSDCEPAEDWVEKMVVPFTDERVVGVQGCYRTKQREIVARFSQFEIEDRYLRMRKSEWIDFIGTYSAAYRRDVFLEYGCFDDRFPIASGEDVDFSFRLAAQGLKMVFQPEAVVYHQHPRTLWRYLKQKFWRAYWRNLLYRRHSSRMVRDSYTPNSLKFQTLCGLLFPFSLIGLFFSFPWTLLPVAAVAAILLLSLPFTLWVLKKDPIVGILTPLIHLLRTFAFTGGAYRGLLKGLWLNEDYL
jgi:cellulose synthase/poly-beta-1,6-N-acetylglucosamine synthase-like glycosyltransferase